jgi:hypothetical protein
MENPRKVFTFYVKPIQSFYVVRKNPKKFLRSVEKPLAARPGIGILPVCRPQDVEAEDFFGNLAGFHAKTTGRFSDDGAVRTTRARLVSASGRPRRASAEKMPVGFRAVQIPKKSSSLPLQPHLATLAP